MTRKPAEAGQIDVVAVLAALSLFLATIEFIIPKPGFLRLGLANLAFLVGLTVLRPRWLFLLAAVKVAAQGVLFGTLFSYTIAFSAAGSLAAALVMLGAHRLFRGRMSLVGVSVCGALASNAAQLAAAGVLLLGRGVWLIAPPLFLAGTATSVVLGLLAERFVSMSEWVKRHRLHAVLPQRHSGALRPRSGQAPGTERRE